MIGNIYSLIRPSYILLLINVYSIICADEYTLYTIVVYEQNLWELRATSKNWITNTTEKYHLNYIFITTEFDL